MQTITEAQFRKMGQLAKVGSTPERIAKRVGVSKDSVRKFMDGQSPSPVGLSVFEEMTRPSGITKDEHVAWLAASGYKGFTEGVREPG